MFVYNEFFFEVSALTSNNQNVLVAVSSNNKQLINDKNNVWRNFKKQTCTLINLNANISL